ncbi:hydrolase [Peribacillus glennii]|uniref:Hydrolase n=1 Tax=Peribacillus glennii TaxID=2303991 RepID=A0A372LEA4_9BACI|nr:hydrolase [Peribacillus glennii]RFU64138.1 hydrolase [Peribacillus glennii]
MEQRTFQSDGQWNIVYYPPKPSGFAVLLIGDRNHFVEQGNSYWMQHPGRSQILERLKEYGYLIFSSNFYQSGWGSPIAVEMAKKIYWMMMRSEILNDRIHILAEGTGALTAIQLMNEMKQNIRSAVFLDPCLNLQTHMQKEKDNKFFYKRKLKEIAAAFGIEEKKCEQLIFSSESPFPNKDIPLKIIHIVGSIEKGQTDIYKKLEQQPGRTETNITYLLPEKRYKIPLQIGQFFKKYETSL